MLVSIDPKIVFNGVKYGLVLLPMIEPKKVRVEFFDGYECSVALEKHVKKARVIDKRQDHYHEKAEDPDSGKVIHECTMPLSEHRNHSYAKFKNDDKGKP